MTIRSPLRFFLTVSPPPASSIAITGAVFAMGAWTLWLDPGELDSALGPLLLVQMFAASSGFLSRARRGHFDPVFVGAHTRMGTVAAHAIASILPVAAAWFGIVVVALSLGSPAAWSALAGRRAAGMFIVSAMSWAIGFGTSRGMAGVMWIGVLMIMLVRHDLFLAAAVLAQPPSTFGTLRAAAILIACPFLLLGDLPAIPITTILVAVASVAVLAIGTIGMSAAMDFSLLAGE